MTNIGILNWLLSGPYSHFKQAGDDDWRDSGEKNAGLSLSSKGWYDHKAGTSGSLLELAKEKGYSAAATNLGPANRGQQEDKPFNEQSVWKQSTKVQPESSEWNTITGYFTSHRCIPEDHYADLLKSGLIRLNEYKEDRMVVYPALDWENFEALREGKPHQIKRLQRIFLNPDNSKQSKKHLGKADPPFAFIAPPLDGDIKHKRGLLVDGIEDGLSLRAKFPDRYLFVAGDKGSLRATFGILEKAEDVLIVADHDTDADSKQTGQAKAWELAETLRKNGVKVGVKMPQSPKDDANKALQEGRLEEWLKGLVDIPEDFPIQAASEGDYFKLLKTSEIASSPPIEWIVKKVIPAQGIAFVYGMSGSGKSFLALDMAAAICNGSSWFGNLTKQTPVVYIVLEGEAGIRQRVKAWERHYGKPLSDDLRFIMEPINLRLSTDVEKLIASIKQALQQGCMVIVDTYSQAIAGSDENSARDTGEVLKQVKLIQSQLQGLVVLIGHTGKDASKGLRGSSAMFAALDAAIEVSGSATAKLRSWKTVKVKDGAAGKKHNFSLKSVSLGTDEDGDEISSCVIAPQELLNATQDRKSKLSGDARLCYSALEGLTPDPQQPVEVTLEDWKQAFFSKVSERGEEAQSKAFRRSKNKLLEDGHICEGNEPDTFILAGQSGHVRDMSAMS